jgi:hypothetical protein
MIAVFRINDKTYPILPVMPCQSVPNRYDVWRLESLSAAVYSGGLVIATAAES